jgi:hypothetical protein
MYLIPSAHHFVVTNLLVELQVALRPRAMFSPRFPPTTRRAFHPTRSSPSPPTTLQDGLPGGFGTATSTSETAETSLFSDYGPGEGGGNSWEHHGLDFSLGPVQGVDGVDLGSIRMRGGIQKYHQQGGGGEGGEGEGWGASFTDDLVVVDEDVEEESEEDEIRTTRRSFYPDRDRTARQSTTARSRLTGTSSPLLSPAPPKSTEPLIDFLAPSVPGTPEPRFAPLPPPPSAQLQHLRSEIDSRTQVPQAYTQQQQHPPPANLDAISQLRAAFSRARADVPYSAPSLDQPKPEAKVRDWLTDTSSSHSNDPSPSAPAPSTSNIPPSNRSRPHIIPHPNETRSARGFPPPSSRPPTSPVYPAHTHHSHTQPHQHTQISVHHSLPPHLEEDDIDPIARDQDPLPSESESPPTPPPRLPTTFGRLTNHRRSPSPPLVDDYPQKAAHPSSSSPPTKSPQQPQTALQAFLASHPKPSLIERKPVPPPPPPAETEDEPELESDLGSFFPLGRSSTPKNLSQSFSNPNHSRYSTSNLSSSRASAAISGKGKEREVVTTPPLPSPPPSRPTTHSTPPKTIVSSPSRRRRQAIAAAANPITSTFSASPESPFVPSHSLKRSTETAPTPQRLHFDFPSSQPSPLTTTISARHSSSQLRRTSSNASSSSSRSHPQDRSFERIQRDLEADPVLSHSNTSSRSSLTKSRNRRVTIVEPVRSPPRQPQQQTSDEEGGEALTRSPRRPGGDGYRSRSQYDDQGEDSHRQPSFIVDPSFARQRPRPNTSSSHSPRLSSSRTAAVPPSLPPSAPTRRSSHPPAPPSFARPVDQHLSDRESTSFADASSTGSSSADQSASMTAHLEAARRRKRMFASPIKGGKMDRSIGLEEEKVEEEDGGNQGKKKEEEGEEIVTKAEEDREEMESEQKCLVDERGAGGEEVAQDEEKRASTSAFIPPIAATSSSTLPSNPVPSPPTPPSPHPSSSTFPIVPSSPRQTSSHSHSNPTAGFSSPPSPPPPPPPPESHSTPLRQPKRFLHTSHLLAAPSTPGGPGSPIVPGGWGWTPGGGLKDKARRESQLRRVDEGSSLGTQQEEEELDGDGEEGGEEGTEGREKEAFESSPPMTTIPLSSTLPPAHRQPVTLSSSMGSGPGVGGSLSPIGSLGRMRSPRFVFILGFTSSSLRFWTTC